LTDPLGWSEPLAWSDLAGRRIGIWGVGVEGLANLHRAEQLTDDIVVVDAGGSGSHRVEDLETCDVVVKSPGISRYRPEVARLEALGIAVVGGLGLWLADAPADRVVCVTGTKGKSTTVSIIGHLMGALGIGVFMGGNLGRPPQEPAEVGVGEPRYWIIETSSYQAADATAGPGLVAVTSLSPDHVEWHGDVERYFTDKLSLCTLPGVRRTLAADDDAGLHAHAPLLGDEVHWVQRDERAEQVTAALGLVGRHNVSNTAMALAIMARLMGAPRGTDELVLAASGYQPLTSRLTPVGAVDGVVFIDDCLSTNVLPTIAALEVFAERPTALIVGGHDRGIDYSPLADALAGRTVATLVLCLDRPDNGRALHDLIERRNLPAHVTVVVVPSLEVATAEGYRWCRPHGGVVLLSPAAPTRGHSASDGAGADVEQSFADYRAKSAAFQQYVAALGGT